MIIAHIRLFLHHSSVIKLINRRFSSASPALVLHEGRSRILEAGLHMRLPIILQICQLVHVIHLLPFAAVEELSHFKC